MLFLQHFVLSHSRHHKNIRRNPRTQKLPFHLPAVFVKRLQRDKDCVHILSDNPKYKEMTEDDESQDFRVIGKVRYVMHKVKG